MKLYEVYEDEEFVHLVMENCHGGCIDKIFTSSQKADSDSDDTSSDDELRNNSFCSYQNEEDLFYYRKLNSE